MIMKWSLDRILCRPPVCNPPPPPPVVAYPCSPAAYLGAWGMRTGRKACPATSLFLGRKAQGGRAATNTMGRWSGEARHFFLHVYCHCRPFPCLRGAAQRTPRRRSAGVPHAIRTGAAPETEYPIADYVRCVGEGARARGTAAKKLRSSSSGVVGDRKANC